MSVYYPPPVDPRRPTKPPMKGWWVVAGIGLALVGHLLTVAPLLVVYIGSGKGSGDVNNAVFYGLLAQGVLFLVCLIVGILLLVGRSAYRGIGLGLLIGWPAGLLVVPLMGFGLCVQAMNNL
jgi:hypothetical protein